jgi:hypothetical protein
MIFGHCVLSGKKQLVEILSPTGYKKYRVRKVDPKQFTCSYGPTIIRHAVKHAVKIHGENFFRQNWLT